MDFQEEVNALSAKCKKYSGNLATEEATKNTLVMPFIKLLGYDPFDPTEVVPEYTAAIGDYKDARVDYALMREGKPLIIIECKAYGSTLDAGKCNQLMWYFHGTEAKVAILTDGNHYQFFSDLEETNKMDSKPYMEFVLENPDTSLLPELKKLSHDAFNEDDAMSSALVLKYTREFKRIMEDQLQQPEDDFLSFFLHKCYEGRITSAVRERFGGILKDALDLFIRDKINERFQSAIADNKPQTPEAKTEAAPEAQAEDDTNNEIVTTDVERAAYFIVKSILNEVVDLDKVMLNDYKGFCNICYDKVRKVILRCYFNVESNKRIALLKLDTPNKEFETIAIQKLDEIYKYADRIKSIAKFLANDNTAE